MRLIDADKVFISGIAPDNEYGKGYVDGLKLAIKRINAAPTIEAAPVVHGRWKYVEVIGFGLLSTCSECGHHNIETNYCPNCGAKMEEGDSDG